ncbi:MAG: hypothetical protein QW594_00040 [Candidatus Woesearchaeota archaeon]
MATEKELDLSKLKNLPLQERVNSLKDLLEKKKKETSALETLYLSTLQEKASFDEKKFQERAHSLDDELHHSALEQKNQPDAAQPSEKEQSLDSFSEMYSRLQSYNEMAREGIMNYNAFSNALAVYQQLNTMIAAKEQQYQEQQVYLAQERLEELSQISKRMMKQISGSYLKDTFDYRGFELR